MTKSALRHKRAVAELSPVTREFFNRIALLEQQPITGHEKEVIKMQMVQLLTPEQRAIVEREAMRAAMELASCNPAQGNRAQRRSKRK